MSIEARLARLERSNRRHRLVLAAILGVGLALVLGGQAAPDAADVIRAERFEVLDADANVVATLAPQGGGGALAVRHPSGAGATLQANERAGEMFFYNEAGQTTLNLSASPDGRGTLETFDGKGNRIISLTSGDDGAGALVVRGGRGNALVAIDAENGAGRVTTMSDKGTRLVSAAAARTGAGLIVVGDKQGRRVVSVGSANARGVVVTSDASGKTTDAIGAR